MSDYLWDKTGEADPEVERLEELLGAFAHRPGRLELPPEEVAAPARIGRPRFAWYAAAAALLLAALAGALVALRPAAKHEARLPAPQNRPVAAPSVAPSVAPPDAPDAPAVKEREVTPAAVEVVRHAAPRRRASQARTPRGSAGRRSVAPPQVLETPEVLEVARVEEFEGEPPLPGRAMAAALGRGFSVKRQLFDALLLTSAKLKEVQRKTQGADAEPPAEHNR